MTVLAKTTLARSYLTHGRSVWWTGRGASTVTLLVAVGWLTVPFAQRTGGRDPMALTQAAAPLMLAVLVTRPWRRTRMSTLLVAAAVAVAALVVCILTPPGWFGANRAASYGVAAAGFVVVAGYVRCQNDVYRVASLLSVAGAVQFFRAFVPWWGSRDPSTMMTGTFYWHNQFGAFMLVPAVLGLGLILANRSPYRAVGWLTTPFGVAGVVFSASRGCEFALVAGWIAVGALITLSRTDLRMRLALFVAASALAAVTPFALSGPPLFDSWHLPWAGTQAHAATGQTLQQNSSVRVYFWRQALIVFEHHPVEGVGYGALSDEAVKLTPSDWPRSPLAHNDYLQALADGGLVLGIPFMAAVGAIVLVLVRRAWALLRRGTRDPLRIGVVVCGLALMAHAAIDFDWSYPALFAAAACVLGLGCAGATRVGRPDESSIGAIRRSIAPSLVAMLCAALLVGAAMGRHGGLSLVYRGHAVASADGPR